MGLVRRVNYFQGRLRSADDFQAEQEYQRARSRLHNRRLHCSGVASGLTVSLAGGTSRPAITVRTASRSSSRTTSMTTVLR